jgi:hypothetical protein
MNAINLRRYTGIFGLIATIISLVQFPLYFMYLGARSHAHLTSAH